MAAASTQAYTRGAPTVTGILCGGLVAGAFDIVYAMIANTAAGSTPVRTLQSVASGLLGRPAFQGGWTTAALGLLLHFVIALGAATVYSLVSRRLSVLRERAWLSGLLFGALVYLTMNLVVVPASAAPFAIPLRMRGLLVHMFLVGLPIALAVRRFSSPPSSRPGAPHP